jgi:hypothetical protein
MNDWTVSMAAAALVLVLSGCASPWPLEGVDCAAGRYTGSTNSEWIPTTPRLDCMRGDSVNTAIARQALDKDAAAKNAGKTAAGMDGSAARDAIYNYQKSFRTPEPAPATFSIGTGTMPGSGGQ